MDARNVQVLEYGVDIHHFKPGAATDRKRRSILAVGRLVHKKGFAQLAEAFAKVLSYYNDSTLTIAGSGPLLGELQSQSRSLGIGQAVRFAGNIGRNELPSYYAAADIVVVPSVTDAFGNRDGLPNVFLEALSSGCAIVASDIPGIQNVVRNGNSALLVPSGDVEALSKAILDLLGSQDRSETLRNESRRKALSDLSWEAKSKELEKIYNSVLKQNKI
jgi:glycosyltransferase involved in cell wall biosynthesis